MFDTEKAFGFAGQTAGDTDAGTHAPGITTNGFREPLASRNVESEAGSGPEGGSTRPR
ncbi:cold shock domain protein CspD [Kitasatospora sp. NBC_00240]|uniref:cold shock domain protein CspD n=1 Tax=Kitasatospora sp. NBC_00240 TaxID=2903567 RepID=UPI002251A45A|nr:cold shock domain protein CspD [Kitasatospora sp. NBC_00240]MCX5215172.1 cold shock domain protein CspD [Kitasatospora sp. NBC_00240]